MKPDPAGPTDYDVVDVFYGTNRRPDADSTVRQSNMFQAGLIAGGGSLFALNFLLVGWLFKQRAVAVCAAALCLLGTLRVYELLADGARTDDRDHWIEYTAECGSLELGICQVSIPPVHETGQVEEASVFRLEFREDPLKHVMVQSIKHLPSDEFFGKLRSRVDDSLSRSAFVFVHGYNVTFEAAAKRTAQIAFDLKFDGAPILYSWPSQGNPLFYGVDEKNVELSVEHLTDFLEAIAEFSGARTVHLIAHSMGNRALTGALRQISDRMSAGAEPRFHEVILTAPDISARTFKEEIAPAIVNTAQRVTLYASSNDEALLASEKYHGVPRAGYAGPALVVAPRVETIDVSLVDTSLLGHSYYGSSVTVLDDIARILFDRAVPPDRPGMTKREKDGLPYWELIPSSQASLQPRSIRIR